MNVQALALPQTDLSPLRTPDHIIGVPNGNRRKAEELGITLSDSYVMGAWKALEFLGWVREAGAHHGTLFGLSTENLGRDSEELDALAEGALLFTEHVHELDCRVHVFGDIQALKDHRNFAEIHRRLVELNAANVSSEFTAHIAVNYSGAHEDDPLPAAIRQYGVDEVFRNRSKYIMSAGVPRGDLFIRTGFEQRTSGLLPDQVGYAELCFPPVLWADFTKEMFQEAVRWYGMQKRNFGK